MCDPISGLIVASTLVSAGGQMVAGAQAKAMAKYEQRVAERNAALEREAAKQEIENTRTAALKHYRNVAKIKGQQVVAAGGNGVVVDFGTAQNAVNDTDVLANEDITNIYKQGYQNLRGRDINASNQMAEGRAARARGKNAMTNAAFGAVGTVLGGASQYAQYKKG